MRKWADRIDYRGAPRALGYRFTFEDGEGIRFRHDGKGCRLWYLGMDDYEKAHDEADSAAVAYQHDLSWRPAQSVHVVIGAGRGGGGGGLYSPPDDGPAPVRR